MSRSEESQENKSFLSRFTKHKKQPLYPAAKGLVKSAFRGTENTYKNAKEVIKDQGMNSLVTTSGRKKVKNSLTAHSIFKSRGDLLTGNFFNSSLKKGVYSTRKNALDHKKKLNSMSNQTDKKAYINSLKKNDNSKVLKNLQNFKPEDNESRVLRQLDEHNKRYDILIENDDGLIRNSKILNSNTSGFMLNFLKIKYGYLELSGLPNLIAECNILNQATGKTIITYKDVNPITNLGLLVNNISTSSRKDDSLLIIEKTRTNLVVNRPIYNAIGCYIKPKTKTDKIIVIYFNPIIYKRKNGGIDYNFGEVNTGDTKNNTLTNPSNLIEDKSINKLGFMKPIDAKKFYVFIKYNIKSYINSSYNSYLVNVNNTDLNVKYYFRGIFYKPMNRKITKGFNITEERNFINYKQLEDSLKEEEERNKNSILNVKTTTNELNKSGISLMNISKQTEKTMLQGQIDKKINTFQNMRQREQKKIEEQNRLQTERKQQLQKKINTNLWNERYKFIDNMITSKKLIYTKGGMGRQILSIDGIQNIETSLTNVNVNIQQKIKEFFDSNYKYRPNSNINDPELTKRDPNLKNIENLLFKIEVKYNELRQKKKQISPITQTSQTSQKLPISQTAVMI
jgi:hypothetical protein